MSTECQRRLDVHILRSSDYVGVAVSSNGLDWQRGHGSIEGARGEAKAQDVGRVLEPNGEDWWWLDTRHMAVSDVQVGCRIIFVGCLPDPACQAAYQSRLLTGLPKHAAPSKVAACAMLVGPDVMGAPQRVLDVNMDYLMHEGRSPCTGVFQRQLISRSVLDVLLWSLF